MMSSTLVETVSINYDDFNDSFLTCGTCLCTYDAHERTPKLLPCSHTVCRNCLESIVAAQHLDTGCFRCPICRENVHIPQGGVVSLPPSFIVNQLLDLMAHQRRDVIPKCSVHASQELLFCETCDIVYCVQCSNGDGGGSSNGGAPSSSVVGGGGNSTGNGIAGTGSGVVGDFGGGKGGHAPGRGGASEHTVIPFATAIKRMSEILLYKAHLCTKNLNAAYDAVTEELRQLELTRDRTLDAINRSFQVGLLGFGWVLGCFRQKVTKSSRTKPLTQTLRKKIDLHSFLPMSWM